VSHLNSLIRNPKHRELYPKANICKLTPKNWKAKYEILINLGFRTQNYEDDAFLDGPDSDDEDDLPDLEKV